MLCGALTRGGPSRLHPKSMKVEGKRSSLPVAFNLFTVHAGFRVLLLLTLLASCWAQGVVNFPAGSFLITHTALRDSPERFLAIIQESVYNVSRTKMSTQQRSEEFYKITVDCPNNQQAAALGFASEGVWRDLYFDIDRTDISILADPFNPRNGGIRVDTWMYLWVRCRYAISVGVCGLWPYKPCLEACTMPVARGNLQYDGPLRADFRFTFDPISREVDVQPDISFEPSFDNLNLTCGSRLIGYVRDIIELLGGDIENELKEKIQSEFTEFVDKNIRVPQTFNPTDKMQVSYWVKDMTFVADDHILVETMMNLSAINVLNKRIYHAFPDDHIANTPAADTDWSALIAEEEPRLVYGLRISVDLFTAMSNMTQLLGLNKFVNSTNVLDAELLYDINGDIPRFQVTDKNSIVTRLPYGKALMECNSDPNKGLALLNFTWINLRGDVSAHYLSREEAFMRNVTPGLFLQYDEFDFSTVDVTLEAPPIPLDKEVMHNVFVSMMEGRRNQSNEFLRNTPLSPPENAQAYFPNPSVQIQHSGDGRGFLELLTRCTCGNMALLYPDYTIDQCKFDCYSKRRKRAIGTHKFRRRQGSSVLPPLNETALSSRPLLTDSTRLAPPKSLRETVNGRKRQTNQFLLSVFNNRYCSLGPIGDAMSMVTLTETEECINGSFAFQMLMPGAMGSYYRFSASGYTSLWCSSTSCDDCLYSGTNRVLNTCLNIAANYQNTFALQQWNENTCLGGAVVRTDVTKPIGMFNYIGTSECASSYMTYNVDAEAPQSLIALGFLEEADATKKLEVCGDTRTQLERELEESLAVDGFSLGRNDTYMSVTANETHLVRVGISCGRSKLSGLCTECFAYLSDVAYFQCISQVPADIPPGVPIEDVTQAFRPVRLRHCEFADGRLVTPAPIPTAPPTPSDPNATLAITEEPLDLVVILVPAFVGLGCLIFCVLLCWRCGWAGRGWAYVKERYHFVRTHSWTFGAPPPDRRWHFTFLVAALVASMVESMVWTLSDSINIVQSTAFQEQLGFGKNYIAAGVFEQRFVSWSRNGSILLWTIFTVLFGLLVDALVRRGHIPGVDCGHHHSKEDEAEKLKRTRAKIGLRARKTVWFVLCALHILMLLGLPLLVAYDITKTIVFNAGDSQILQGAQDFVQQSLGYSAGLVMFNVILDFFVNTIQPLPAGVMFGTLLFLADRGKTDGPSTLIISRGLWITAALINVGVNIIAPVALMPALLMLLHRFSIAQASWLGLVWLAQWGGSLVFVVSSFYKHVEPAEQSGQLRVHPHRNIFLYAILVTITTMVIVVGEWLFREEQQLFTFMVLYRLCTFLLTACFIRVWMESYRPKWSRKAFEKDRAMREAAKKRRDARREAANNGGGDVDGGGGDADRDEEPLSRRRDTLTGAGVIEESDPESRVAVRCLTVVFKYASIPIRFPLQLLVWLIEGRRVVTNTLPKRRSFLVVGLVAALVKRIDVLNNLLRETTKEWLARNINNNSDKLYGFRFPPDDRGGALFDPAFEMYDTLLMYSFVGSALAVSIMLLVLVLDLIGGRGNNVRRQASFTRRGQRLGFTVMAILFVSANLPSLPDYPSVADLDEVLPKCTEDFNHLVQQVYGSVMGLFLSTMTMFKVLPILLLVMPTTMRATRIIIDAWKARMAFELKGYNSQRERDAIRAARDDYGFCVRLLNYEPPVGSFPPAVVDHAFTLWQLAPVLSPLLTGVPFLFFYVFFGDTFVLVCFIIYWVMPVVLSQTFSPDWVPVTYYLVVQLCHAGPLIAIVIHMLDKYDLLNSEFLIEILSQWSTYSQAIGTLATICLANVIVCDIIYLLIFSLYPEYSAEAQERRKEKERRKKEKEAREKALSGASNDKNGNGGGSTMNLASMHVEEQDLWDEFGEEQRERKRLQTMAAANSPRGIKGMVVRGFRAVTRIGGGNPMAARHGHGHAHGHGGHNGHAHGGGANHRHSNQYNGQEDVGDYPLRPLGQGGERRRRSTLHAGESGMRRSRRGTRTDDDSSMGGGAAHRGRSRTRTRTLHNDVSDALGANSAAAPPILVSASDPRASNERRSGGGGGGEGAGGGGGRRGSRARTRGRSVLEAAAAGVSSRGSDVMNTHAPVVLPPPVHTSPPVHMSPPVHSNLNAPLSRSTSAMPSSNSLAPLNRSINAISPPTASSPLNRSTSAIPSSNRSVPPPAPQRGAAGPLISAAALGNPSAMSPAYSSSSSQRQLPTPGARPNSFQSTPNLAQNNSSRNLPTPVQRPQSSRSLAASDNTNFGGNAPVAPPRRPF